MMHAFLPILATIELEFRIFLHKKCLSYQRCYKFLTAKWDAFKTCYLLAGLWLVNEARCVNYVQFGVNNDRDFRSFYGLFYCLR